MGYAHTHIQQERERERAKMGIVLMNRDDHQDDDSPLLHDLREAHVGGLNISLLAKESPSSWANNIFVK